MLDFLRHEAATDFDNVAKSVSEDLKHEGNVVEEDTDDEEEVTSTGTLQVTRSTNQIQVLSIVY